MGSVNPVFILPQKLKEDTAHIADMYADSITQSAGQFCTNPGIMVAIEDDALNDFVELLSAKIKQVHPVKMLHTGIAKNFHSKRKEALTQQYVAVMAQTNDEAAEDESIPTIAQTTAAAFLQNPLLHKEVFGPFSLLVVCKNHNELLQVAQHMEGQLTATLIATPQEAKEHTSLVQALHHICGRLIFNSVPTGVRVCLAMQHGGPYPATTDSRFTAVGADGIKRFARPICYQNWMNDLLPDELKNKNPLQLWRTVNDRLTQEAVK
jgi:NADP-dependent aldehyde dehydrogenase